MYSLVFKILKHVTVHIKFKIENTETTLDVKIEANANVIKPYLSSSTL